MKRDLKKLLLDAITVALDHHREQIMIICSGGPPITVDVKVTGPVGESFVRVEIDLTEDNEVNARMETH